ncbi:hypothetical protein BX600DRAFT_446379 [Xylariales sp. PMI_506]|nr:hypothetical protein BX600DRAFT_446379 [Xylariales sp. PMI_506]
MILRQLYPIVCFVLANAALATTATATATASATATSTQTSSVTSIFLPGFDQSSLVASVITAAPSATTYFVQCGGLANSLNCELGSGVTVVEGPSTFDISVNNSDITVSEACVMSSDTASCTYTMGDTSGQESAAGLASMYLNVTITAGFDALASARAEAATMTTSVSEIAASTSTTSSSSGAGVPRATWEAALAGVAALVGGAAIIL